MRDGKLAVRTIFAEKGRMAKSLANRCTAGIVSARDRYSALLLQHAPDLVFAHLCFVLFEIEIYLAGRARQS